MKTNYYLKLLLAAVILSALYYSFDLIFASSSIIDLPNIFWGTFANVFVIIILGYYVSFSTLKGFKLALSVFTIYYILGHFNILIEAYIFNITDRTETFLQMLQGLFMASVFAPILVYVFNKWDGQLISIKFVSRPIYSWVWRVLLGVFLYLIFYLTAGLILQSVYPDLMNFYQDKLPPFELMIFTQFPRGLLFAIVTILMLSTLKLPLIKKAVIIGLAFSILGGIAPLISPNEFMPGNIRFVHGIEVGISNFLYGFVLSYLLGQRTVNEKHTSTNIL